MKKVLVTLVLVIDFRRVCFFCLKRSPVEVTGSGKASTI